MQSLDQVLVWQGTNAESTLLVYSNKGSVSMKNIQIIHNIIKELGQKNNICNMIK